MCRGNKHPQHDSINTNDANETERINFNIIIQNNANNLSRLYRNAIGLIPVILQYSNILSLENFISLVTRAHESIVPLGNAYIQLFLEHLEGYLDDDLTLNLLNFDHFITILQERLNYLRHRQ